MSRTIIQIDESLIDFGEWCITPKVIYHELLWRKHPPGEHTFSWIKGLTHGISNLPEPLSLDVEEVTNHYIDESELRNKTLIRCLSGSLTYKVEYNGKCVFVKYSTTKDRNIALFIESLIALRFLPKHPNIQKYIGVSKYGLISEYIEGKDFLSVKRLSDSQKQKCMETLNFLHSMNIVHGDIRPQNLMRDNQGQVKFIDFPNAYSSRWRIEEIYNKSYKLPTKEQDITALNKILNKS